MYKSDWSLFAPFPDIRTSPNTRLLPSSFVDFVPWCFTRIINDCCPVDFMPEEIFCVVNLLMLLFEIKFDISHFLNITWFDYDLDSDSAWCMP